MSERWRKLERLLRSLDPVVVDQGVMAADALGDPALFDHLLADVQVLRPKENLPPMPSRAREALALAVALPTLLPGPRFDGPGPDMPARQRALLGLLAVAPADSREAQRIRRVRRLWVYGHRGALDVAPLPRAFPALEQLVLATCSELENLDALGSLAALRELAFVDLRSVDTRGVELPPSCWTVGMAGCGVVHVEGLANVHRLAFHTNVTTQRIQLLRGVREMTFTETARVRIAHVHALSELAQLESLEIDEIDEYETLVPNQPWRRKAVPVEVFVKCPHLRALKITHARVENESLRALIGHPSLERLEIDAAYFRELPRETKRSLPFVLAL